MGSDGFILPGENLVKFYPDGNVNALADVTFAIPHGQYVAIMATAG